MVNLKTPGFFGVALLLMLAWPQQALAEVQVIIDRNPVQVNESFQLVFSLDQSPEREPDFSILQQHFLILSNNRSNSISIINGEYQRSVKWSLQLMAKQVGEFMIPAIRFGKQRSNPFQVTVEPSSLASVPHDRLVLELLVDNSEVYVQSQVILTLRLLSATNISAYQFGDVKLENLDAMIEPLGDVRQYQTRIADKSYLVLEKQYALFPQQAGRLRIAPVMTEVRLPSGSSFDPFQTGGEIHRLRSQQAFVDVEAIPAEFKAPYWLPANKVELREDWQGDLTGLVAGEPITRSLTLVAEGLTAAQLPELVLPQIDGIKQYPDQPGLQDKRSSKGINGMRVQKVALIPGAAGSYMLPEISLPWWNLQSGELEMATIPARELIVNAAPSAVEVAPATASEPVPVGAAQTVETNRFWLWLSLLLACGWALSGLYWWLRSRQMKTTNPPPLEHPSLRQVRKKLQQACNQGDAIAARHALLAWGQALLEPRRVENLHQLVDTFGEELALEIQHLNRSLYAQVHTPWQGENLWRLCQQLEKNISPTPDTTGLLPLNPAA